MSTATPPPVTAPPSPPLPTVVTPPAAQPIAVTVQMPPEKHDYLADGMSGGIGLIGALVGAYAAYRFGLKAANQAKDRERKERENHLSFAVIHKLNRIYSAQMQVRASIEAGMSRLAVAKAKAEGEGRMFLDHLSMEVRPFSTALSRVSFSADEVAAAGRMGGQEALKIVMVLDERHNTTAELLDQYRAAKAEFNGHESLSQTFDPERGYADIVWTEDQYKAVLPKLFVMDAMVTSIHGHSKQDEKGTYDAIVAVLKGRAKDEPKADYRVTAPDGQKMKITSAGVEAAPPDVLEAVQEVARA